MLPILALLLQPEEPAVVPDSPITEADVIIFAAFVLIIAGVFSLDMIRTWWGTNEWRREARRRRRALR